MNVVFIVPCFNAEKNLDALARSLISQENKNWMCVMIDDMSDDSTWEKMEEIASAESADGQKFLAIKNNIKNFALKNIVNTARIYQNREDVIVAVIDGDDSLCNDKTVDILINEYEAGNDVVWTAHKWDINGMNISSKMPEKVDPYAWKWCSSHLRTFNPSLLSSITDDNFKDTEGNWFERGYDQALMLPIIKVSKSRKFVDDVCYLYNINSVSIKDRSWEERKQISTINLVRSRGFLK